MLDEKIGVVCFNYLFIEDGESQLGGLTMAQTTALAQLISKNEQQILEQWLSLQKSTATARADLLKERELREQSRDFLQNFSAAVLNDSDNTDGPAWKPVKEMLAGLSRSRVDRGFSPVETAMFVFSLKQPLFEFLRKEIKDAEKLGAEVWLVTVLLDKLGLYTTQVYQQTRESVIARQQEELLELSTPVVELWESIVALPLIGTLDSARTQVVMENLLEKIVANEAMIAIIDITGVPTVDTLVAQHLLKTVAAARLMGADCIISGMRPQIAQTIVHLGVNLSDVVTKATLADAFAVALQRTGAAVTRAVVKA
jgi:rsbT co-antagonist protein RsbR